MRQFMTLFCPLALFACLSIGLSAAAGPLQCYSCTNYDNDRFTLEVKDANWAKLLRTLPSLTRSPRCADPFDPDDMVKQQVHSCPNGLCLKITVNQEGSPNHILRTCLPNAKDQVPNECATITNSKGHLNICTCDEGHCNNAFTFKPSMLSVCLLLLAMVLTALYC